MELLSFFHLTSLTQPTTIGQGRLLVICSESSHWRTRKGYGTWWNESHTSASENREGTNMIASNPSPEEMEKAQRKARRNEIVQCTKCGMELPRKKLKKHKRSNHAPHQELMILDKAATKSQKKMACANCGRQGQDTWLFERTTRGAVSLCAPCKKKILAYSFSAEAIEKRRLASLKATLKELRQRKTKLPADTVDAQLTQNIVELEAAIKRPPEPRHVWSPVLSGCFEGGKRR